MSQFHHKNFAISEFSMESMEGTDGPLTFDFVIGNTKVRMRG